MTTHDLTLLAYGVALGCYLLLMSDLVLGIREDKRRAAELAPAPIPSDKD